MILANEIVIWILFLLTPEMAVAWEPVCVVPKTRPHFNQHCTEANVGGGALGNRYLVHKFGTNFSTDLIPVEGNISQSWHCLAPRIPYIRKCNRIQVDIVWGRILLGQGEAE